VLGGRERRERISVAGLLVVTAVPDTGTRLRLEAWFDSLDVRRDSPEGSLEPDTDGMIGGRYRGHLTVRGTYAPQARPFIPDGVAEVADLSGTMDDFLPLLPPVPLRVGERWADGGGVEIRRLRDSIAGDTLLRFEVHRARRADAIIARDTARIPATQDTREEERFAWHPREGLVRRDRTIVVETRIPPGSGVPVAVRSRVSQHVLVARIKTPDS
jgi:hypothetical protein